jgi:hypothetical protein
MKTKLLVMVLFAGLIILSCKKEDKQPAPTNNTGGGGGGGGGNNYPASSASVFSGIFTTGRYVGSFTSGTTTVNFDINQASAYFSNTPMQYVNSSTAVKVSTVALNGDSLWYNSSSKYYLSNSTSSAGIGLASEAWSVTGANGIATFSVSNNFVTPSATGYTALPSTINKSSTYVFNINNVANSTSSEFLISDGASGIYFKTLQSGNNTFTVSPSDLSSLATTTMGSMALILSNKKAYVISGKDYQFNREFQYNNTIQINP